MADEIETGSGTEATATEAASAPAQETNVAVQENADAVVPATQDASVQPKADEKPPAVDEKLVDRAVQLGLTAKEIEGLDGMKLEDELRRREAWIDKQLLSQYGPPPASKLQEEKAGKAVEAKAIPAVSDDGVFAKTEDGSIKFSEEFIEQFDDVGKKAFKGIERVIDSQRLAMSEMRNQLTKMNEGNTIREFDSAIANLPPELRKTFGEGSSLKMKDGPQLEARRELLRTMDAVDKTYRNRGNPLSEEDVIRKAVNLMLEDQIRLSERQKIVDHLKKRSAAIQPRPTNRKATVPAASGKKPGSYEEFEANPKVQEVLSKFGIPDSEDEEVELPAILKDKK